MPVQFSRCLMMLLACGCTGNSLVHADANAEANAKFHTPHKIFGNKAEIDKAEPENLTREGHHCRAGNPLCLSPLAGWSKTPKYWGYYAGGGNPGNVGTYRWSGEPRRAACEGTWGLDYMPWYSRVRLNWWHGRKFQDGSGQYQANGPVYVLQPELGPKPHLHKH